MNICGIRFCFVVNRFGSWHKVCVWFGFVLCVLEVHVIFILFLSFFWFFSVFDPVKNCGLMLVGVVAAAVTGFFCFFLVFWSPSV